MRSFSPGKITEDVIIIAFTSGAMCTSLMTVVLNDRLRRCVVIFLACVIFMFGEAATASSISVEFILLGRFISGMGVGKMLN